MWVEIYNSAAVVPAGHKLRMSIQTADTPHLMPNAVQAPQTVGAVLHLYHDRTHRSELVLPVVGSTGEDASRAAGWLNGVASGEVAAVDGVLPTTSTPLGGAWLGLATLVAGLALAVVVGAALRRTV